MSTRWEGNIPVFQWEVDPGDPALVSGSADITVEDWEFGISWQLHPADLVYVSVRAEPCVRSGPMPWSGRKRDFRPFVNAFAQAYGLGQKEDR